MAACCDHRLIVEGAHVAFVQAKVNTRPILELLAGAYSDYGKFNLSHNLGIVYH